MKPRKVTAEESRYLLEKYGTGRDLIESFIMFLGVMTILVSVLLTDEDAKKLTMASKITLAAGIMLLLYCAVKHVMKKNPAYYTRYYCCVFNINDRRNLILKYISHDSITITFRAGTNKKDALLMLDKKEYTGDVIILSRKQNMQTLLMAYPYNPDIQP